MSLVAIIILIIMLFVKPIRNNTCIEEKEYIKYNKILKTSLVLYILINIYSFIYGINYLIIRGVNYAIVLSFLLYCFELVKRKKERCF